MASQAWEEKKYQAKNISDEMVHMFCEGSRLYYYYVYKPKYVHKLIEEDWITSNVNGRVFHNTNRFKNGP